MGDCLGNNGLLIDDDPRWDNSIFKKGNLPPNTIIIDDIDLGCGTIPTTEDPTPSLEGYWDRDEVSGTLYPKVLADMVMVGKTAQSYDEAFGVVGKIHSTAGYMMGGGDMLIYALDSARMAINVNNRDSIYVRSGLMRGTQANSWQLNTLNDTNSPATPPYAFYGDNNTGMYRHEDNGLAFAGGGTNKLVLNADGTIQLPNTPATAADASVPVLARNASTGLIEQRVLAELHTHGNMTVLNGLADSGGELTYLGNLVFNSGNYYTRTVIDAAHTTLLNNIETRSLNTHNHNLADLTEHSYNSLVDTPDLSDLHAHSNKATLDRIPDYTGATQDDVMIRDGAGISWVALSTIVTEYIFENALTEAAGTVKLGGDVTGATAITDPTPGSNDFSIGTVANYLRDFSINAEGISITSHTNAPIVLNAGTNNIQARSNIYMYNTGSAIVTAQVDAYTFSLTAWDVNDTVYRDFITLTAGNTPTMTFPQSGGGTTNFLNADGGWTVPAGGSSTFIGLTDTPADWTGGVAGFMLMVNSTPDAVEFVDPSGYAVNNFSGTLTGNWIITGSNSNQWRVQSVHAATGSVYAEFVNAGKSFNAVSWSGDAYTGGYGSLYVDDIEINLILQSDGPSAPKGLYLTTASIVVRDDPTSVGLQYYADYSTAGAALGDRWIPDKGYVDSVAGGGMVWPAAGIALSTGSSWAASITNNSANWNAAFGWGNHAGLYDAAGTAAAAISSHESTYNHANYDTAYGWGNHAGLYANLSHTHGNITNAGAIGVTANRPIITSADGVLAVGNWGSSANTFCQGNDSRLSDARTPTAHASTHLSSGSDTIALFNTASAVSGLVPGSSGNGATYFLNATGAWSIPAGGGAPGGSDTHVQFNNSGAFGGSANFTWNDNTVLAITSAAHAPWIDFPTALPLVRSFVASREATTYGEDNYNSIQIHARPTSGHNAYAVLGAQALGVGDHSTRFNLLLRGVGSSDYETVFSADYDSIYYWKRNSTTADITHQLIQVATPVSIFGWDDSNSAFQIEIGTGAAFSDTPEVQIKAGGANIMLDSTPASTTGGGIIALVDVDDNGFGVGAALHMDTDGNYIECDADLSTKMPCSALALEIGTGSGKRVLLMGYLNDSSYSFSVGAVVYVSISEGGLTTTAPSGTGHFVQAVGIAMTTTSLYFNPDFAMVEIV